MRLLFLKLSEGRNTKNNFFRGVFLKKKTLLFWGSKKVVFKTQILNLFLCVCFFLSKKKLHANFLKKYKNLGPLAIFENENFAAHAPKIWIYKIIPDLWLSAVFCPIKK